MTMRTAQPSRAPAWTSANPASPIRSSSQSQISPIVSLIPSRSLRTVAGLSAPSRAGHVIVAGTTRVVEASSGDDGWADGFGLQGEASKYREMVRTGVVADPRGLGYQVLGVPDVIDPNHRPQREPRQAVLHPHR